MTHEHAVALVAVSLEALIHRRHIVAAEALTYMPAGLLRVALNQLDGNGANTSAVRAEFIEAGFDLSDDHQSAGEPSGSRVPKVIAAAILAKFLEGWSKSRIAREFRLNRRTVIRICASR
jgi:hypothetical protein